RRCEPEKQRNVYPEWSARDHYCCGSDLSHVACSSRNLWGASAAHREADHHPAIFIPGALVDLSLVRVLVGFHRGLGGNGDGTMRVRRVRQSLRAWTRFAASWTAWWVGPTARWRARKAVAAAAAQALGRVADRSTMPAPECEIQ